MTKVRLKNDSDLYQKKIVIEAVQKLLMLKFNSKNPEESIIITIEDMKTINPEITFFSSSFYFLDCLTSAFNDFIITHYVMRGTSCFRFS